MRWDADIVAAERFSALAEVTVLLMHFDMLFLRYWLQLPEHLIGLFPLLQTVDFGFVLLLQLINHLVNTQHHQYLLWVLHLPVFIPLVY